MRALIVGVVAFVAALGAAWGPAHADGAVVAWPAPGAETSRPSLDGYNLAWHTPLLLSSHRPERLVADLPCSLRPEPTLLLSTTAARAGGPGLELSRDGRTLRVVVDGVTLAAVPWPDGDADCRGRFEQIGNQWTLSRGGAAVAEGEVFPPAVSGLWSELDPTSPGGVRVELHAEAPTSRPSARQWALLGVSACAAIASLVVWRRGRAMPDVAARWPWPRLRRIDAAMVGGLVAWWAIGPWFFDDGWLMGTVRARIEAEQFHNYFDTFASPLPLGFGHHVLLWPFASLDLPFLWWRLVPLAACVVAWVFSRGALDALVPDAGPFERGVAALAFGLFASGWLLTLRPEPVVAALSAVAFAGSVAFARSLAGSVATAEDGSTRADPRPVGSLLVALVAVAVACTLHPSGLVAAAALVPALGAMWSDVRLTARALIGFAYGGVVASTVAVWLLFADTDVRRWQETRALFAGDGFHSKGFTDELDRYRDLLDNGTAPQVAAIGLAAVVVVSFIVGLIARRGRWSRADGAPAALVVGALLLALAPSKWTYHFGSGAAIASIAIGVEVGRRRGAGNVVGATLLSLGAVVVSVRALATTVDPQYFWRLGYEPSAWWVAAVGAVVVAALVVPRRAPWSARVVAVVPATVAVVLLATAVTYGVAPAIGGPAWATPRAVLRDAFGGCSVADRLTITEASTPLRAVDDVRDGVRPGLIDLSYPPSHDELVAATATVGGPGEVTTPWFLLDGDARLPELIVAVGADRALLAGSVSVEWATDRSGTADISRRTLEIVDAERSPFALPFWRLVRLPDPPPDASVVRLVVREVAGLPDGSLSVTGPWRQRRVPLRALYEGTTERRQQGDLGTRVLVSPSQLPLLTCPRPPAVANGIAEMPDLVIGFLDGPRPVPIPELGSATGPWYLAEDLGSYATRWLWLDGERAVEVYERTHPPVPIYDVVPAQIRR